MFAWRNVDNRDFVYGDVRLRKHVAQIFFLVAGERKPDALACEILDVSGTNPGPVACGDREHVVVVDTRRIAHDLAYGEQVYPVCCRDVLCRRVLRDELRLAALEGAYNFGSGAEHLDLQIKPVLDEDALLDADELRKMIHVRDGRESELLLLRGHGGR